MKIIIYPNRILSQVAHRVNPGDMDAVKSIVKNMFVIMRRNNGGGLAAPQVGISKRIIVWLSGPERVERVAINPVIVHSQGKFKSREGCLSVPNIQRDIRRKRLIEVVALDENDERGVYELTNREAVVVQHEIDHLNGITILDGVKKRKIRPF